MFKRLFGDKDDPKPILPTYRLREGEFRPEYLAPYIIHHKPTRVPAADTDTHMSSGFFSCLRQKRK